MNRRVFFSIPLALEGSVHIAVSMARHGVVVRTCPGRHRRVMTGNSQPCSTAGAKARYNLHNERKLGADRGGRIQCGTLTCWAHEGKTDHDDSAHIVALVLFSPQEAKHRALPVTFSCLLFCLRGQACRTRSSPTHRPIRAYGMANPRRQCRRCRRNHSDSGRLLVARARPTAFCVSMASNSFGITHPGSTFLLVVLLFFWARAMAAFGSERQPVYAG